METYVVFDRHLSSKVRSYIFLVPQGMYSLAVPFEINSYVLGNLIAYRLEKNLYGSRRLDVFFPLLLLWITTHI